MIMLDTNAASALMLADPAADRLVLQHERVAISAIVAGELSFGVARRRGGRRLLKLLSDLLSSVETIPWDAAVVEVYARIRADCTRRGKSIGPLDMLIAAHAVALQVPLATRDKTFARLNLPDLKLLPF